MSDQALHAVTGAFGYSGKRIARLLLDEGIAVRTLTNSPHRPNPFGGRIEVHPFHFDEPDKLTQALAGVSVLYNTYWVRFNTRAFNFAAAVRNTHALFGAAKAAGVERIVHVSITNPSANSPYEYFRGKAQLEEALRATGISHAVLRPAVLFGGEDILTNNIAWLLRRFPAIAVFGDGAYRLQPIHVEDFAKLAVEQGASRTNTVIDAIGPETFTFRALVEEIGAAIGKKRRVISVSPRLGYLATWLAGLLVNDVILTRDEIDGLMDGLLVVESPPAGTTKLTEWARQNADTLGRRYASELARRRDRLRPYVRS